jgi:hypothetical protein
LYLLTLWKKREVIRSYQAFTKYFSCANEGIWSRFTERDLHAKQISIKDVDDDSARSRCLRISDDSFFSTGGGSAWPRQKMLKRNA